MSRVGVDCGMADAPHAGLCGSCVHAAIVVSGRGSQFVRCGLSDVDGRYAKYPRLPVIECAGFEPAPVADAPSPRKP